MYPRSCVSVSVYVHCRHCSCCRALCIHHHLQYNIRVSTVTYSTAYVYPPSPTVQHTCIHHHLQYNIRVSTVTYSTAYMYPPSPTVQHTCIHRHLQYSIRVSTITYSTTYVYPQSPTVQHTWRKDKNQLLQIMT